MEQALNIGWIVIGLAALVGLANGLVSLNEKSKGKTDKYHERLLTEQAKYQEEQGSLYEGMQKTLNSLDKTLLKLDITLEYTIKEQEALRKDVNDILDDVSELKNIVFVKDRVN